MELYKNLHGTSNVVGYEIGPDYIIVQFSTGASYTYTYESAGNQNIETMKKLAIQGFGLNAYINTHVKYRYVK